MVRSLTRWYHRGSEIESETDTVLEWDVDHIVSGVKLYPNNMKEEMKHTSQIVHYLICSNKHVITISGMEPDT